MQQAFVAETLFTLSAVSSQQPQEVPDCAKRLTVL